MKMLEWLKRLVKRRGPDESCRCCRRCYLLLGVENRTPTRTFRCLEHEKDVDPEHWCRRFVHSSRYLIESGGYYQK